ncbi:MAG TPA: hypothetical protein GX004_04050 [Firmicutes bacterium]|jgi:Spy/CpxP family protein refolding chaperone|nr:hypothetical protein [Bacillota bacterium]
MEKLVKCHYWKEYQGLNGWTMFCSAGAFSKKFSKSFAEGLGCTEEQRAACKKIMETNMGYSALPEIVDENIEEMATPKEKELTPTIKNKDT